MRVLHVSEAMGGGVATAMLAMVEATPECDHHLLMSPRRDSDTGSDLHSWFSSVQVMPQYPVRAATRVQQVVRDLYPDIVHAHSSISGVVARVVDVGRAAVVYSPHNFAFERRDITWAAHRFYHWVERRLAERTDALVALAPHEVRLATNMGYTSIVYVPNRAISTLQPAASWQTPLRIAVVGRICPQKDWRYLMHLKRYASTHLRLNAVWQWIGGGDRVGEDALTNAGIHVAGWMPQENVIEHLQHSQVYLHTAAWEAAPISIFEAAQLGLPLTIRSIASLDSLKLPGREADVVALANRLKSLEDESVWNQSREESLRLARNHQAPRQAEQLRAAYEQAMTNAALRRARPLASPQHGLVTPPLPTAATLASQPTLDHDISRIAPTAIGTRS